MALGKTIGLGLATVATLGAGTAAYANGNPDGRKQLKKDPKQRAIEVLADAKVKIAKGLESLPDVTPQGAISYVAAQIALNQALETEADEPHTTQDQKQTTDSTTVQSVAQANPTTNDETGKPEVSESPDSSKVAPKNESLEGDSTLHQKLTKIVTDFSTSSEPKVRSLCLRIKNDIIPNIGDTRAVKGYLAQIAQQISNAPRNNPNVNISELSRFNTALVPLYDEYEINHTQPAKPTATTQPAKKAPQTAQNNPEQVDEEDLFSSVADDDLQRAEQELEKARKQNKDMLLKALQKLVSLGINPAEKYDWYEEWAIKNNVTPEMLVAQNK